MEKARFWGLEILIAGLIVVVAGAIMGIPSLIRWKHSRDQRLVYEDSRSRP